MSQPTADTYRERRRRMVEEQIRCRDIRDDRVLAVMESLPREQFVDSDTQPYAYEDRALPIELGQTISQPYMVAAMTAALHVKPGHRVLEIGTGSGYQTAILAQLAAEVYTVERLEPLSRRASQVLQSLNISNVHYFVGDGTLGWAEHAPFDRILVTAGAPTVPQPLVEQLVEFGRLVIPVGRSGVQRLTIVDRYPDKNEEYPTMMCRFVPLVGEAGWHKAESMPRE